MSGQLEQELQLQAGKQQSLGGKFFHLSQYFCNENSQLTRFKCYSEGAGGLPKGVSSPCVCTKLKLFSGLVQATRIAPVHPELLKQPPATKPHSSKIKTCTLGLIGSRIKLFFKLTSSAISQEWSLHNVRVFPCSKSTFYGFILCWSKNQQVQPVSNSFPVW